MALRVCVEAPHLVWNKLRVNALVMVDEYSTQYSAVAVVQLPVSLMVMLCRRSKVGRSVGSAALLCVSSQKRETAFPGGPA